MDILAYDVQVKHGIVQIAFLVIWLFLSPTIHHQQLQHFKSIYTYIDFPIPINSSIHPKDLLLLFHSSLLLLYDYICLH